MLFNSYQYLLFYILFFSIFFIIRSTRLQIAFICISCIYFYGSWNYSHIFVMIIICIFSYFSQFKFKSIDLFIPSLILMLSMLFFYKYYNFFAEQLLFFHIKIPDFNLTLPIGISFYTFHAISFAIDKRRKVINQNPDKFINIVAYISFFPQLVAGPIVRASKYLPQLQKRKIFNKFMFKTGAFLFAIGLFKKIVIADNLGIYVDQVFSHAGEATSGSHWLAFYCYGVQIYYDFCGYSDMAIGVARTLGYKFSINFNRPYLSCSVTEFWRRWHISLSSWLRDYLYICLGGNRKGLFRTYINLFFVMLLGGLWHGASWTFVVWGAIHGCYLAVERFFNFYPSKKITRFAGNLVTVHLVLFAWIFFRSHDFFSAYSYFYGMFDFSTLFIFGTKFTVVKCLFMLSLFIFIEYNATYESFFILKNIKILLLFICVYLIIFMLFGNFSETPFIYFQF